MTETLKPVIDQRAVMAVGTLVPVEYVKKIGNLGKEIHQDLLCRVKAPLVFTPDGQVISVLSRMERPDKEAVGSLSPYIEVPHSVLIQGGEAGNFRLEGIEEELDFRQETLLPGNLPVGYTQVKGW